jgi:hypothetical protein
MCVPGTHVPGYYLPLLRGCVAIPILGIVPTFFGDFLAFDFSEISNRDIRGHGLIFAALPRFRLRGTQRSLHAPWIGIRQSKSLVGMTTRRWMRQLENLERGNEEAETRDYQGPEGAGGVGGVGVYGAGWGARFGGEQALGRFGEL